MHETLRELQNFLLFSSVGVRSPSGLSGFRETCSLAAVTKIVVEFDRRFMDNMGTFETVMFFDPKYERDFWMGLQLTFSSKNSLTHYLERS